MAFHLVMDVPRGPREARPEPEPGARASARKKGDFKPRRPVRLQELRREFEGTPFADEPRHGGFARAHESTLASAIGEARTVAFAGAPEAPDLDTEVECRTIRCRIDVCSVSPAELELFTSALSGLEVEGERLFERLDVETTTRGALGVRPEGDPCHRIVVSFRRDAPRSEAIRPAGAGE